MKVGASVFVRETAPSLWAGRAATVVDVNAALKLYRLRFRDGAELWFALKEIVRGT